MERGRGTSCVADDKHEVLDCSAEPDEGWQGEAALPERQWQRHQRDQSVDDANSAAVDLDDRADLGSAADVPYPVQWRSMGVKTDQTL